MSAIAFAAAMTWPAIVLAPAAWLATFFATALGLTALGPPVIAGASVAFSRAGGPLVLEDPYLLAGIPLYLALWAIARRPLRAVPWPRLALGVLILEVVGGITMALVAWCVARGWTASPAREPFELVALVFVAACRVLPLPLWLALDPTRGGIPLLVGAARGEARAAKRTRSAA